MDVGLAPQERCQRPARHVVRSLGAREVEDRRRHVDEGRECRRASRGDAGHLHQQGDLDDLPVERRPALGPEIGVPDGLAQVVVLSEVVAVVGEEDQDRRVGDTEHVELLDQPADPAVDHRDLARVRCVTEPYVVFCQPGLSPVVVAGLRLAPVVVRGVQPRVVVGRVPRLVWVPHVDEEEELLLVVPLEPLLGGRRRAGDPAIGLVPPGRPGVEPLLHPLGVALAAEPEEVLEAAVVPEPVADVEGRVDDAHREIPGLAEELGQRRQVGRQRRPRHERQGQAAGKQVGARGHGRERSDQVVVEDDRPTRQAIEGRGVDPVVAVGPDVIPAERVGDDHDEAQRAGLRHAGPAP